MKYLDQVENYIQDYMEQWNFSGIVCVCKDGKIALHKENGFACVEFNVKNCLKTGFSLGSNSKQFTAFAVMRFVDKGQILLNASANTYLPDSLLIDPQITVYHLLSHTSGLYNWEPVKISDRMLR